MRQLPRSSHLRENTSSSSGTSVVYASVISVVLLPGFRASISTLFIGTFRPSTTFDLRHRPGLQQQTRHRVQFLFRWDPVVGIDPDLALRIGDAGVLCGRLEKVLDTAVDGLGAQDLPVVQVAELRIRHHVLVGHVRAHHPLAHHVAADLLHPLGPGQVEPHLVVGLQHPGALLAGGLQVLDRRVVATPAHHRHPELARAPAVIDDHSGGRALGLGLEVVVERAHQLDGRRGRRDRLGRHLGRSDEGLREGRRTGQQSREQQGREHGGHLWRMASWGGIEAARRDGRKAPSAAVARPTASAVSRMPGVSWAFIVEVMA